MRFQNCIYFLSLIYLRNVDIFMRFGSLMLPVPEFILFLSVAYLKTLSVEKVT